MIIAILKKSCGLITNFRHFVLVNLNTDHISDGTSCPSEYTVTLSFRFCKFNLCTECSKSSKTVRFVCSTSKSLSGLFKSIQLYILTLIEQPHFFVSKNSYARIRFKRLKTTAFFAICVQNMTVNV